MIIQDANVKLLGVKHLNNHEVNKPSIFLMSLTYLKLQEAAWRSG